MQKGNWNGRSALAGAVLAVFAACANPEGDFQEAAEQNDIAAYRQFVSEHPDHPLAAEARERIRAIEEQAAWEEAQAQDSVQAYQSFIDRYPQSEHAQTAAERQRDLRAAAEWEQVRDSQDPDALRSFLERFPQSEYGQEARRRLDEAMAAAAPPEPLPEPEPPPEGDFQVQLAAFRQEQTAQQALEQLVSRHAGVLGDVQLRLEPPSQGSSYYRVRTAGVDREAADRLCAQLMSQGQDCLVVPRG